MKFQRVLIPLVVVVLVAGIALAATLSSYLPSSGAVSGWRIVAGSSRGGSDNATLYQIYDGAVDGMRQAGLTEAYQRQYTKGGSTLTMDVFRFKSWTQSKAYYVAQRQANQSASSFKIYPDLTQQAFIAENSGAIVGMGWAKTCVVQIGLSGSGNAQRYEVYKFLKYTLRRIQGS
jgi:hypothetical protein